MSDKRPCGGCERGSPFIGEFQQSTQCRLCWLFHNDTTYRQLFGGPAEIPLGIRIKDAATAHATWAGQGCPIRPQEEQDKITKICQSCEFYNAKNGSCMKCGCKLNGLLLNKIRMASEHCPINKW